MSTSLILSLLLAFNVSDTPEERLAEFAYHISQLVPADQITEILAVAYVETRFRPDAVSPAGCVCWLQQMCGRYGKPSCEEMVKTEVCIKEYLKDRAYWKKYCGKAWLDAYNAGWAKCWDGIGYKKHGKRCKGKACTSYSTKVQRTEKRFRRWLEKKMGRMFKEFTGERQRKLNFPEGALKTIEHTHIIRDASCTTLGER